MNCISHIPRFFIVSIQKKCLLKGKLLKYRNLQFFCHNSALNELSEPKESDDLWDKVIYNEVFHKISVQRKPKKIDSDTRPVFLKYLLNNSKNTVESTIEEKGIDESSEGVYFPYEIKKQFVKELNDSSDLDKTFPESVCNFTPSDSKKVEEFKWNSDLKLNIRNIENPVRWIPKCNEDLEKSVSQDVLQFGSSSPHQRVSTVPCGGCGAFLHCNDPSIPGFIPAEIFENRTKKELLSEICQRCHFLREYHVSLGVNVSSSEYVKILSNIKEKQALVILMIDMLDIPCSIFPGILDIIGPEKPVVIVGNKVDLLIQDHQEFLKYFKTSLLSELKRQGITLKNIKHVSLISAKTGYGVEELIDQLHLNWGYKGDVYLIGCTNVGKSTLFNTLIQSDYCKTKAANILHRATISTWPGTTLNLLKFPILKPTKSRLYARLLRLQEERKEEAALQKFQWMGQNIRLEQIPLKGHIGRTFKNEPEPETSMDTTDFLSEKKPAGLDPKETEFINTKWLYDTPGVVHNDQIVNLLTTSELLLTVPQKMLLPRNFHLKSGQSIFIAGIGRLDYLNGPDFIWFTVFASMELPITVTKVENADYVYKKLLGSRFFRVPMKGKERLAKWPDLSSKKFEIIGRVQVRRGKHDSVQKQIQEATADIVLSSAGWVAITVPTAHRCLVEAWTPEGKGIYLRKLPIIARGHTFRGEKIWKTPAFGAKVREIKGYSLTDEPPL